MVKKNKDKKLFSLFVNALNVIKEMSSKTSICYSCTSATNNKKSGQ